MYVIDLCNTAFQISSITAKLYMVYLPLILMKVYIIEQTVFMKYLE